MYYCRYANEFDEVNIHSTTGMLHSWRSVVYLTTVAHVQLTVSLTRVALYKLRYFHCTTLCYFSHPMMICCAFFVCNFFLSCCIAFVCCNIIGVYVIFILLFLSSCDYHLWDLFEVHVNLLKLFIRIFHDMQLLNCVLCRYR